MLWDLSFCGTFILKKAILGEPFQQSKAAELLTLCSGFLCCIRCKLWLTDNQCSSFVSLNSFLNLRFQNTVTLEVMSKMFSVKVSSDRQNSYKWMSGSSNLKRGSNKKHIWVSSFFFYFILFQLFVLTERRVVRVDLIYIWCILNRKPKLLRICIDSCSSILK